LSNVIKLRRPVENIRIRHQLGAVHTLSATANVESHGDQAITEVERHADESYQPLVDEYRRGVEEGIAQTEQRLRDEFSRQLKNEQARVSTFIDTIGEQFSGLHDKWEHQVTEFAFAVARVIIKREVTIDREGVLLQAREALRHLVGVEKVKVRVHPEDEAILRDHRGDLSSASDSLRDIVIEVDDKVERGGCIVESDSGNVDARLSTQLQRIEESLFKQD